MRKILLCIFVLLIMLPVDSQWISFNDINSQMISVEIRGNVQNEGIYELKRGTTIQEALQIAGLLENSSIEGINQTQILHHQDVITITKIDGHLIHINSATIEELMCLPGIGEKTAKKIIEYRTLHLFQSLEELMEVSGIGKKKFESLEGLIGL
ncbi:MAG: ComEA family DNA-binding protein [Erysipelotrichaceae bacterium]|nr:ComEA family DNA-binding protein [Erysipelotrichaceae bacterium]